MRIVSLFSGAGGLDLGFIRAGHEVIWANDNFEDAVMTYRHNIGNHIVLGDIENIPASDIPDCDMLIGGFPCQGFSVANTRRHIADERNKLYLEYQRILSEKKPKFFLAENVKGILSLAQGEVFKIILDNFVSAGYDVKYEVLNAADFGVPQKRERVIIVGVRKDVDFDFRYPDSTHAAIPTGNQQVWLSIGQALANIPEPTEQHNLLNHTNSKFKLKFNGYVGNRFMDPNKPAPTVTARGDDRGGVVVLHHPNNTRRMTVRELATTQSFPIDFYFTGNKSSAYRQIGNAVPMRLAYNIAMSFPL